MLDFINPRIKALFQKTRSHLFRCFTFVTQSIVRAMALRPAPKSLSFQILRRSSSIEEEDELFLYRPKSKLTPIYSKPSQSPVLQENCNPNRRKHKDSKKRKKKKKQAESSIESSIPDDSIVEKRIDSTSVDIDSKRTQLFSEHRGSCLSKRLETELSSQNLRIGNDFCEKIIVPEERPANVCRVVPGYQTPRGDQYRFGELRQRNLNGDDPSSMCEINVKEERIMEMNSEGKQRCEPNGCEVPRLETAGSLDWKKLIESDPKYMDTVERSQVDYLMKEIFSGNSLQSTTGLGSEKERERVYDTIFRLPWRCELLIDVGFFVCFDSFISLLTIMPTRVALIFWKLVIKRHLWRPSAVELSDFGCFFIMVCGVTLLQRTDISLIYHMIRGQGTIKLYVVYNVLEIFDKLCQSIGGDVLQTLFYSAEGLANSSPENVRFWIWRFVSDQALAVASSIVHSFILLAQAVTFSTCIVAHNNALLALLVSNNFSEIKSNVFKRFSKENIRSLVYADSIERFHISAFVLFVLAQNILEAEGPWFETFLSNALLVYVCEMLIDIIKHSFLAKFNDVKPIAYSEFLEDLCQQVLNKRSEDSKKNLTFIPLAPACVVIRVLTPLFTALLPCNPLPWRPFLTAVLIGISYVMLASLKVMIGMSLQKFSAWYIDRCQRRKHHLHAD